MKKAILLYAAILLTPIASGQTEKQLVPSDLKQQTIVTEPPTLYKGFFRGGFTYAYSVIDKIYDSDAKKNYLPYNIWGSGSGFSILAEYGFTDRLTASLDIPYGNDLQVTYNRIVYPDINTNIINSSSNRGRGIGDCSIEIKYQLVPEKENKSSLTGSFILSIPTGKKNYNNIKSTKVYDLPTGDGYFSPQFELRYKKTRYPFSYVGYMSYTLRLKGSRLMVPSDLNETEFKDGNGIDLGGIFNFHLNEWIALKNVVDFFHNGKNVVESKPIYNIDPQWIISYQALLVFQVKKFRIGEGIMVPIKGKNTGADPMLVLLSQYIF